MWKIYPASPKPLIHENISCLFSGALTPRSAPHPLTSRHHHAGRRRDAACGATVGAHATRRAPAVMAGPVPNVAGTHRVAPRLQGLHQRQHGGGTRGRHRARAGSRARELQPHR
jgi:hypothetical protein